ncbi:imidazole glycerol phosphate synthase subunit HisH [Candidatus Marinamargulisbacteria bacterium SCGC AG-439-L15]|nr:imidazole glycerol phosphate synthase subunit HisH [Candidatus Marinamargulisbacteria bacterium SCGC AG-439-L15]
MKKVVILDYGVGNMGSVQKALTHLGLTPIISKDIKDITNCDLLVMPGQGAFETAMQNLHKNNLIDPVKTHIQAQKPFLGICVGFQILFEESSEKGQHNGLGIFPGKLKKFPKSTLKVPHMGWNTLSIENDPLSLGTKLKKEDSVYFVHSYYLENTAPDIIFTQTEYGASFVSAIQTNTLLATQFHPEKSGDVGLTLLETFFKNIG